MSLNQTMRAAFCCILLSFFISTLTADDFQLEIQEGSFWEFGWNYSGCNTDFPGCSRKSGVFRIVVGEPSSFGNRTGFDVSQVWVSGDPPEQNLKFVWKYMAIEGGRLWGSIDGQSWKSIVNLDATQQVGGGFFFYDAVNQVSIFESEISNDYLNEPAVALRTNYGPGGGGCEWFGTIEVCTPEGDSVVLIDYFQPEKGPVGHSSYITIPHFVVRKSVGLLRFSFTNSERPNLAPAVLLDWSDAIVISNQKETSVDTTSITSNDTLYVDFAVGNFGGMDVTTEYSIRLSLDNQEVGTWDAPPPLAANRAHFAVDVQVGPLSPGDHTLLLEADINQEVTESNEGDNAYSKHFTVVTPVPTLVFSQWLNGALGGQLNGTRIILRNNSSKGDSGTIRFQDGSGNPAQVPVKGALTEVVHFSIEPWGSFEVKTDGIGTLQNGTVEVYSVLGSSSSLEGTEVFEVLGSYVSVPASPFRSTNQVYVSVGSEETAGVALYNPGNFNLVEAKLFLVDNVGNQQAIRTLTVGPREQVVAFVDQQPLFDRFFGGRRSDFTGTLHVLVQGQGKLSVLGLLQKRASGALIATVVSEKVLAP